MSNEGGVRLQPIFISASSHSNRLVWHGYKKEFKRETVRCSLCVVSMLLSKALLL